ncbi:YtxH domain-containing protein [Leucobacter sp. wl10]|uniref:YtxH domain-containing protein n=1 Tax=Leucobacter sp. wl10 TaxID=2304677 RepID=UPI000E5B28C4|nr:YtxH domain-containing protein [Leucobacter sp. wl10]RGE19563.1 YtxH domain-containing protein [Leucobacter sp. wl10]
MRRLLWLLAGAVLGFIAAHFVDQTPEGRRFFARVNRGVAEFNRAFSTGYHEVEQAAEDLVDDVEEALQKLRDRDGAS